MAFIRFFTFIGSFIACVALFNLVPWMSFLPVDASNNIVEKKLGGALWKFIKNTEIEIKDKDVYEKVDKLLTHCCKANQIDRSKIKLHIVSNEMVNAFALPDGYLVVYSGLITSVEDEGELSGVLCHEVAHIELNHVIKKITTEMGLAIILKLISQNNSSDIKHLLKNLQSNAFSRELEKEADEKAVEYLIKSKINPERLIDFFEREFNKDEITVKLSWLSTHPSSSERIELIRKKIQNLPNDFAPVLSKVEWEELKNALK